MCIPFSVTGCDGRPWQSGRGEYASDTRPRKKKQGTKPVGLVPVGEKKLVLLFFFCAAAVGGLAGILVLGCGSVFLGGGTLLRLGVFLGGGRLGVFVGLGGGWFRIFSSSRNSNGAQQTGHSGGNEQRFH